MSLSAAKHIGTNLHRRMKNAGAGGTVEITEKELLELSGKADHFGLALCCKTIQKEGTAVLLGRNLVVKRETCDKPTPVTEPAKPTGVSKPRARSSASTKTR